MEEKTTYYQFILNSLNDKEGNIFKKTGGFCSYLNKSGKWINDQSIFGKFVGGDADFNEISEEKAMMIVSKRKKQKKIKIEICIFIPTIIAILFILGTYIFHNAMDKKSKNLGIKDYNITRMENTIEEPIKNDVITGNNWQTSKDKSLLCLAENGTFLWYRDSEDKSDNYYEGTYTVYCGLDAIDYITNDLSEYGITKEEQLDAISRNSKQTINGYYCLVLNNEKCMMDGENTLSETKTTPYYGFYYEADKYLDFANMNTANYVGFNKVD